MKAKEKLDSFSIDEEGTQLLTHMSGINHKMAHLPDLVIDKILGFTPTKRAFQASFLSKQRQGLVSSFSALNFNEDYDLDRHNNLYRYRHYKHRHKKFINFLKGYLDYRDKYTRRGHLDKLSLHTRMYLHRDSSTITKWLKYACHEGLKELDISPKMRFDPKHKYGIGDSERPLDSYFDDYNQLYRLPWAAFGTANSLTSLNLECVRVPHLLHEREGRRIFPSLKTLSLKIAKFYELDPFLFECPSIERLSLTGCSIGNSMFYVCCPSLKSLEVKHCLKLDDIRVDQAYNLESFTFVSRPLEYSRSGTIILHNAFNLKSINISVDYLYKFSLLGCHRALEATIITQYVNKFELFDGYLNANVSVKSYEATLFVTELLDQKWSTCLSYLTHFPRLMSFLTRFSCCQKINFYSQDDVQALIVPKNYRKMTTSVPPLPKTLTLQAWMPNPPLVGSRDYLELEDSLQWIAPLAHILIMRVDIEKDRNKVYQRARPERLSDVCH